MSLVEALALAAPPRRRSWLWRAWTRVHQPRFVSVAYFLQYAILTAAGVYALLSPPGSIEGPIGAVAMTMLAVLLIVGSLIGAIAVLPGRYFLERLAVIAVALAGTIYVAVIIGLHASSPGNRLLQAGFIASFLIHQGVRWYRIKDRDYRPAAGAIEA